MEAIVLAGGFGTRLSKVVKDVPKPMASVANRPFLAYIMDDLAENGIKKVVLAVHYKKECIMDYFKDSYKGMKVEYSMEETPLFTGGAIKQALTMCSEPYVWVVNGDTYFEVPMAQMSDFAQRSGCAATIAVREMVDFSRYGKVDVDDNGIVTAFHEKAFCKRGLINGGIYYLCSEILEDYPKVFSLENECFPELLKTGQIAAFESAGYFIDIGIPEDFEKAQNHFKN